MTLPSRLLSKKRSRARLPLLNLTAKLKPSRVLSMPRISMPLALSRIMILVASSFLTCSLRMISSPAALSHAPKI